MAPEVPPSSQVSCRTAVALAFLPILWSGIAFSQADTADGVLPAAPAPVVGDRILGVIPDYQTITDPLNVAKPLTVKQKWSLALRETVDPFNLVSAAISSGFSQAGNQTPKYGEGAAAYSQRFGAAVADLGTQNFFSAGVCASLFHQDPRYFRRGPESGIPSRVLYSVSRVVIARNDSGKQTVNAAGLVGMVLGIAASNLYYPRSSVRGEVMAGRLTTSVFGSVTGDLLSEFWPDLQKKFFHRKHRP
jgi:hypothetical protein